MIGVLYAIVSPFVYVITEIINIIRCGIEIFNIIIFAICDRVDTQWEENKIAAIFFVLFWIIVISILYYIWSIQKYSIIVYN